MTVMLFGLIAVLAVVGAPLVTRFLIRHDGPDPSAPIIADLLARVHEAQSARVADLEVAHEEHVAALDRVHAEWAERLISVHERDIARMATALDHERESIESLLQWNRIERLDDVRLRVATQQPTAAGPYGALERIEMLREEPSVAEKAAELEEERLTPWRARRRAGQRENRGNGAASELVDEETGEAIIPVGMGG